MDEFRLMEDHGQLLESGIFDGMLYTHILKSAFKDSGNIRKIVVTVTDCYLQ